MTFKKYMEEEFDKDISVEDEVIKAMKELEKKEKNKTKEKPAFGATIAQLLKVKE